MTLGMLTLKSSLLYVNIVYVHHVHVVIAFQVSELNGCYHPPTKFIHQVSVKISKLHSQESNTVLECINMLNSSKCCNDLREKNASALKTPHVVAPPFV